MGWSSEDRWAMAVRILALTTIVLTVVVVLEARTVRRARAELEQLRLEREQSVRGVVSAWTRQPPEEVAEALRGLNSFYAESAEGFGRAGGLCPDKQLDDRAIAAYVFDGFLRARAAGQSPDASLAAMRARILGSDAYRVVHPELALPPAGR